MARSFSEQEKEKIRKRLMDACQKNWAQYGYKKVSVDELCKQAGISKGAFYLFFSSKEALFCDVLCSVQEDICKAASAIMDKQKDKHGIISALKWIYRAYDENTFLYGSNSEDYIVLMNKLSEEQVKKMLASSEMSKQLFLNNPYVTFKVEPEMAISVIYALIMTIKNKDFLPCNHMEIFDFMVEHLIEQLYEEF